MKVGFVTQWYPPEIGTGVPRAIAQGLSYLGDEVHVLTGFPNYPYGKTYTGYSMAPYLQERDEEVTVHRAPLYPDHSRSAARRMLNYASFAAGASLVSYRHFPTPDVWLTYSSPATSALPAMLPRRKRVPHAMVIQDLWPDSVLGSDMAGSIAQRLIAKPLEGFCQATYRSAGGIGVISPGMRRVLEGRGVPGEKIYDTPNWVDHQNARTKSPRTVGRAALGLPEVGVIFLYAGNFGEMQELEALIHAFDGVAGAHLVLIGDGALKAQVQSAASSRANVHVLPPVDSSAVLEFQEAADVLVVSLRDTPLLRVTMPSKMQSSMFAGRPIFVHGAGDVADVVTRAGCGATATPGSPEAAILLRHLVSIGPDARRDLGANARAWYNQNFSPAAGSQRIHDLLKSTIERHQNR